MQSYQGFWAGGPQQLLAGLDASEQSQSAIDLAEAESSLGEPESSVHLRQAERAQPAPVGEGRVLARREALQGLEYCLF